MWTSHCALVCLLLVSLVAGTPVTTSSPSHLDADSTSSSRSLLPATDAASRALHTLAPQTTNRSTTGAYGTDKDSRASRTRMLSSSTAPSRSPATTRGPSRQVEVSNSHARDKPSSTKPIMDPTRTARTLKMTKRPFGKSSTATSNEASSFAATSSATPIWKAPHVTPTGTTAPHLRVAAKPAKKPATKPSTHVMGSPGGVGKAPSSSDGWRDATMTWYDGGVLENPACYAGQHTTHGVAPPFQPKDSSLIAAVVRDYKYASCYDFIELVRFSSKHGSRTPEASVVVQVVDYCGDGCWSGKNSTWFDLSKAAFDRLYPTDIGKVDIHWRRVGKGATKEADQKFYPSWP